MSMSLCPRWRNIIEGLNDLFIIAILIEVHALQQQ